MIVSKKAYIDLRCHLEYLLECALAEAAVDNNTLSSMISALDHLLFDLTDTIMDAAGIQQQEETDGS